MSADQRRPNEASSPAALKDAIFASDPLTAALTLAINAACRSCSAVGAAEPDAAGVAAASGASVVKFAPKPARSGLRGPSPGTVRSPFVVLADARLPTGVMLIAPAGNPPLPPLRPPLPPRTPSPALAPCPEDVDASSFP